MVVVAEVSVADLLLVAGVKRCGCVGLVGLGLGLGVGRPVDLEESAGTIFFFARNRQARLAELVDQLDWGCRRHGIKPVGHIERRNVRTCSSASIFNRSVSPTSS